MKQRNKICFVSIDVEHDYGSEHAKTYEGVNRMHEALEVFERQQVGATLFVTGEVLEKYSDRAREWSRNFEIGCHSYYHNFFNLISSADVRGDLELFVAEYKKIFNTLPRGFRAPSHVISSDTLKIVQDTGFIYDSSVVPHYPLFKKYRGYRGRALKNLYRPSETAYRKKGSMDIVEVPVTGQLFGLPLAGAWIRGIPVWVYKTLFRVHSPRYISLSFHSWDVLHDDTFLEKLTDIIHELKGRGYQFKRGDHIVHEWLSTNRE